MTNNAGYRPAGNLSLLEAHIEAIIKLSFSAWGNGVVCDNGVNARRENYRRRFEKLTFQQEISVLT